jgi:C-5 cytosine-specific DNA methylase
MRPLAIDLYCGLGGWTDGLLAEGWDVIGFDIERHQYGDHRYPAQLVIQDVLTLHGSQFRGAALIVASPPCQAYSYRAMPWKRAKAMPPPDNTLFQTCFRIQREACEAASRHIPMIVENVRGAQRWVGRARWNYGSFYLWGDVPALMPITFKGAKVPGLNWSGSDKPGYVAKAFNTTAEQGIKISGGGAEGWFGDNDHPLRRHQSKHWNRKFASTMIAKIPLPLSRYIAATFHPRIAQAAE